MTSIFVGTDPAGPWRSDIQQAIGDAEWQANGAARAGGVFAVSSGNVVEARRVHGDLPDVSLAAPAPTVASSAVVSGSSGLRYSVETVSHRGRHVLVEAWEERIDENGKVAWAATLADPFRREELHRCARTALDAAGVVDGPGEVIAWCASDRFEVVSTANSLAAWRPRDPAFAARGFDQLELVSELLRHPDRFERRVDYGTRRPTRFVGLLALSGPDPTVRGFEGLTLLRRLPGFSSTHALPALGHRGPHLGIAAYVSEDSDGIQHALRVGREVVRSNSVFVADHDVIAYFTAPVPA